MAKNLQFLDLLLVNLLDRLSVLVVRMRLEIIEYNAHDQSHFDSKLLQVLELTQILINRLQNFNFALTDQTKE